MTKQAGKGSWPPRNVSLKMKSRYENINWKAGRISEQCSVCGKTIYDFENPSRQVVKKERVVYVCAKHKK